MRTRTFTFAAAGVMALAALLIAQDKPEAKGARKGGGGGILHPEMKPEGTWEKPMGSLGEKPAEAWTSTTIEAAVNKQAQPGKIVTRVGEIVDFSCYLQLGKHGAAHADCGRKCVQNGQPIGLLTRDGTLYMIMPEEHHPRRDGGVDARPAASDHMGHIMSVTGTEAMHNGYRALYVQGLKR
jgi:hypothetical protein